MPRITTMGTPGGIIINRSGTNTCIGTAAITLGGTLTSARPMRHAVAMTGLGVVAIAAISAGGAAAGAASGDVHANGSVRNRH